MNSLVALFDLSLLFITLNDSLSDFGIVIVEVVKLINSHVFVLFVWKDRKLVTFDFEIYNTVLLLVGCILLAKECIDLDLWLIQNEWEVIHEKVVVVLGIDVLKEVIDQFIKRFVRVTKNCSFNSSSVIKVNLQKLFGWIKSNLLECFFTNLIVQT